ncbi:putative copper resistance protein D [Nocardioides albertanoniae]|uniref:Putative copper resistance protein D n=1 Tax=Nocardioides albertanoniae TaxID=1175486 RepID=A0A543ABB8_9ACTN|nr:cytochrome c oxidase assembly protein [Nocardioides albertanoniae]TQL69820.1 putative copper resistance protein D [Nocardioides albertanoniae]
MHDHGSLPALGWSEFFTTWSLQPGWLLAVVILGAGYLTLRNAAGPATTVKGWRVASFLTGLVLMYVVVASAINGYAMALAWMHMVLHLTLIMIVPALLVLGHPLTVIAETGPRAERAMRSLPVTILVHPATGMLLYSFVIIGTHLSGFMDSMAQSTPLMVGEQAAYVLAGFLFLTGTIGEEKVRPDLPYLGRIALLVLGMVPDTIVGIVMLQTNHDLYPIYSAARPEWAPEAVKDIQTAGGLMWAGGDGGMMLIAIGLVIAVVSSAERRTKMTGRFLDGVRSNQLSEASSRGAAAEKGKGPAEPGSVDPDSDEALDAYNAMLARMNQQH